MNILIIKLSPIETITSSMFRTLAITRGLMETGNNVDMLVAPYNGLNSIGDSKDFIKNINVIRTKSNRTYTYTNIALNGNRNGVKKGIVNLLKKVWHKFSIYDYTYSIAKSINISILPRVEYDLVISSSDPKSSHIAVKMLKKQGLKYKKWIQYWGDPLTIDITRQDIWPDIFMRQVENHILDNADKIVYVSPFTLEKQKQIFRKKSSKMFFLPVAYMEEDVYEPTSNEKFTIGYYGNYETRVRNLIPFYNACCRIGDSIDVSIYGDTDLKLDSTENIKVFPRGVVEEHKKVADLLVCVLNSKGTQIPGKLYHLAGTNKKVLVIIDGDNKEKMQNYLERFKRFYLCNNSEDDIERKIEEIMNDLSVYYPLRELKYDYISQKFIE